MATAFVFAEYSRYLLYTCLRTGLTSLVNLEYIYSLVIIFDCAWGLCGRLLSEKKNIILYSQRLSTTAAEIFQGEERINKISLKFILLRKSLGFTGTFRAVYMIRGPRAREHGHHFLNY